LSCASEHIGVNESANGRIIIPSLEVVEPCLSILIIAPVAEGVDVSQSTGFGQDIAPGVVGVLTDLGEGIPGFIDCQSMKAKDEKEGILSSSPVASCKEKCIKMFCCVPNI